MSRSRVLTAVVFVVIGAATVWAALGTMSVQVKTGQLRSTPSFLGSTVASVSYGDQVEVLQKNGDWSEVSTAGGMKGWIHASALSSKRVVFSSGGKTASTGASGDELALAGKGFNVGVEAEFKARHRDADYRSVDMMEQMNVSPQEVVAFLKGGGLMPKTGGAR